MSAQESMRPELDPPLPAGVAYGLLASLLFGLAIYYARGAYSSAALLVVLLGLLTLGWAFGDALSQAPTPGLERRFLARLVWTGLLGLLWAAIDDGWLLQHPVRPWDAGRKAQVAMALLVLSYLPSLVGRGARESRGFRRLRILGFAVAVLVAGVDALHASPDPQIDVFTVQQEGAAALLRGKNPYASVHVRDTGPRVATDVPYVYPPMQLYMTLPAYRLAGDVRFAMVAAVVVTGLALRLLAMTGAGPTLALLEDAPALFLWLTPKLFFILEMSWVDPIPLMLLTLSIVAHARGRKRAAAVLLGLTFGAKQTLFWLIPLLVVGLRLRRWQWLTALTIAAASVLPFAAWSFRALRWATFGFVSALPPRPDALTFINWLDRGGVEVSPRVAFPLAACVVGLALWRIRGSTARLTMAAALTYTVFFVFNKWAFANYYFFLLGLCALAAAAALSEAGQTLGRAATVNAAERLNRLAAASTGNESPSTGAPSTTDAAR